MVQRSFIELAILDAVGQLRVEVYCTGGGFAG